MFGAPFNGISGSQHPLKVDYRIPKYIIQLWVNKILVVVVVFVTFPM